MRIPALKRNRRQKHFHLHRKPLTRSFRLHTLEMSRRWKRFWEQEAKSRPRAIKRRTSWSASNSARSTRKCTVWSKNLTESPFSTSEQRTGLSPSRWSPATETGISTPVAASRRSYSAESEKTRRPQLKCGRNSQWQRMRARQRQTAKMQSPDTPRACPPQQQVTTTKIPVLFMDTTFES